MENFLAGWVAGLVGTLVGYPFDTLKVLAQTRTDLPQRERNLRRLYRGATVRMLENTLLDCLLFGFYGTLAGHPSPETVPQVHSFISGTLSGLLIAPVVTPLEVLRIRIQAAVPQTHLQTSTPGLYRLAAMAVAHGGIADLYRGYWATTLREGLSCGIYFYAYQAARQLLERRSAAGHAATSVLLAGSIAGVSSWLVVYPIDVLKTRLQVTAHPGQALDALGVVKGIWKDEGCRGFYRGISTVLIRTAPANAATFYTFELVHQWCAHQR